MNKTERELEFLKIKKQEVEKEFNHYINNYQHSAIYLIALVAAFSGIFFSLGYTKDIHLIIIGGLVILSYKFVVMWIKTSKSNELKNKISKSMDKRFEKLGVNVKAIKKEIEWK